MNLWFVEHFIIALLGRAFLLVSVNAVKTEIDGNLYDCSRGCELDAERNGGIVCGVDDIEYSNECLAICQGVSVAHAGRCQGSDRSPGRFESEATVMSGFVPISVMKRFAGFKFVRKVDPSKLLPGPKEATLDPADFQNKSLKKPKLSFPRAIRLSREGFEYMSFGERSIQQSKLPELAKPLKRTMNPDDIKQNKNSRRKMDVIGTDDRTRITNTLVYPYTTIGRLDYIDGGICTGTVIYENSILTAAHCLFDGETGEWLAHTFFAPARDGIFYYDVWTGIVIFNDPVGAWQADYLTIPGDYGFNEWELDYGVVKYDLNDDGKSLGDVVGYVGIKQIASYDDADLDQSSITGYPGDVSFFGEEMWTMGVCPGGFSNGVDIGLNPNTALHYCDITGGTSGSSLLRLDEEPGPYTRGVNVAGAPTFNVANVFLEGNGIFDNIMDWSGRIPNCRRFCWFFQSAAICCSRFRMNRNRCVCKEEE